MAKVVLRDHVSGNDVTLEAMGSTTDICYNIPNKSGTILTRGNISNVLSTSDNGVSGYMILKPEGIGNPIDTPENYAGIFTPTSYKTSETFTGEHESTIWQMSLNPTFDYVTDESRDPANKLRWTPNINTPGTLYYIRYKFVSGLVESVWSDVFKYRSPSSGIRKPTVEVINGITLTPTIKVSNIQAYGTANGELQNTTITIKKVTDRGESILPNGVINMGTSLEITLDKGILDYATLYNLEITQRNMEGMSSEAERVRLETTAGSIVTPSIQFRQGLDGFTITSRDFKTDVPGNNHIATTWVLKQGIDTILELPRSNSYLTKINIGNFIKNNTTYTIQCKYHGSILDSEMSETTFLTPNSIPATIELDLKYAENGLPSITVTPFRVDGDTSVEENNPTLKYAVFQMFSVINGTETLVKDKILTKEVINKYNTAIELPLSLTELYTAISKDTVIGDMNISVRFTLQLFTREFKSNLASYTWNINTSSINGSVSVSGLENFKPVISGTKDTILGFSAGSQLARVDKYSFEVYSNTTSSYLCKVDIPGTAFIENSYTYDISSHVDLLPDHKYVINVYSHTPWLKYKLATTGEFSMTGVALDKPIITVNGVGTNRTLTLTGFNTAQGTHTGSTFQIRDVNGVVLHQYNDVKGGSSTNFTFPEGVLKHDTSYVFAAKFHSGEKSSVYSTVPSAGSNATVKVEPTFTISGLNGKLQRNSGSITNITYSVTGGTGVDAEHISTEWEIKEVNTGLTVYSSISSTNLTELNLKTNKIDLNPNYTHIVRLRKLSRSFGWSNWAESAKLTIEGVELGLDTVASPVFTLKENTYLHQGAVYGTVSSNNYAGVSKFTTRIESDRLYRGNAESGDIIGFYVNSSLNETIEPMHRVSSNNGKLYECIKTSTNPKTEYTNPDFFKEITSDTKLPSFIELLDNMNIGFWQGNNAGSKPNYTNRTILPDIVNVVTMDYDTNWVKIVTPETGKTAYITKTSVAKGLSYEYIKLTNRYFLEPMKYTLRFGTVLYYVYVSTYNEIDLLYKSRTKDIDMRLPAMFSGGYKNTKEYWTPTGVITDNNVSYTDCYITIVPIAKGEEPYNNPKITGMLPTLSTPYPGGFAASYNPYADEGFFGIADTAAVPDTVIRDFYRDYGTAGIFTSIDKWLVFYRHGIIKILPMNMVFTLGPGVTPNISSLDIKKSGIADGSKTVMVGTNKYTVTLPTLSRWSLTYENTKDPYGIADNNYPIASILTETGSPAYNDKGYTSYINSDWSTIYASVGESLTHTKGVPLKAISRFGNSGGKLNITYAMHGMLASNAQKLAFYARDFNVNNTTVNYNIVNFDSDKVIKINSTPYNMAIVKPIFEKAVNE